MPHPPDAERDSPARRSRWVPTALVAAVALTAVAHLRRRAPETMVVHEVVRDLLAEPDAWRTVRGHPRLGPRAGVLCPSPDPERGGADMPALVLAPPGEVRISVRDSDDGAVLRTAAGVGFAAAERLGPERASASVRFEVLVNGERVFDERIRVERDSGGTSWVPVAGDVGLELRAGDFLTLRTSAFGPAGEEWVSDVPIPAGFRRMLFERDERRVRERSSPERPNVVVVVQDTLRADRMSVYGYGRETSPRAAELARRGVLFEDAYASSSWTWPSTASLLTGLLPPQHGVTDDSSPFLDLELDTLAEVLQRAGYTTAAWSGNPLIVPGKNFGQGFETFRCRTAGFWKSDEIVPEVTDWIRDRAGTRFFLYLHLVDVHEPHLPSDEARRRFTGEPPAGYSQASFNRYSRELLNRKGHTARGDPAPDRVVPAEHAQWISDLYDACVFTGDEWLGAVLDTLRAEGLEDETLVVFTSDHGEELLDHGFLAHGQSLFRELVRVPLIAAGPGLPRGERVAAPVSNRHLAPTLAAVGGARLEGVADGLDLLEAGFGVGSGAGSGADARADLPLITSTTHGFWNGWHRTPIHGLRIGPWALHWAPEAGPWASPRPTRGGELSLFDLDRDPGERHDRAPDRPLLAESMRDYLEARLAELHEQRGAPGLAAGEATLELLREIGYLGE